MDRYPDSLAKEFGRSGVAADNGDAAAKVGQKSERGWTKATECLNGYGLNDVIVRQILIFCELFVFSDGGDS